MNVLPHHRVASLRTSLALAAGLALPVAFALGAPVIVDEPARAPYAIVHENVTVTVGRTVSLVEGTFEFMYVRVYDSADHLDPLLIDVPVIIRETDTDPGAILKIANARLRLGSADFRPRDVLLLDHTAYAPEPDLPDGARIALINFNPPRGAVKPRFKVRLAYDQTHIQSARGEELSIYVPMLPDYDQLKDVLHFQPDDFTVTFIAEPAVRLRRESVNADVVTETPETVVLRPRHRESIIIVAEPVEAEAPASPPAAAP